MHGAGNRGMCKAIKEVCKGIHARTHIHTRSTIPQLSCKPIRQNIHRGPCSLCIISTLSIISGSSSLCTLGINSYRSLLSALLHFKTNQQTKTWMEKDPKPGTSKSTSCPITQVLSTTKISKLEIKNILSWFTQNMNWRRYSSMEIIYKGQVHHYHTDHIINNLQKVRLSCNQFHICLIHTNWSINMISFPVSPYSITHCDPSNREPAKSTPSMEERTTGPLG